jgi:hypothetical protein
VTRRTVDWALLVVLVGSWAVLFARGVEDGLRTGRGQIRMGVSSAAGPDSYPTILWEASPDLVPGDALLEVEGVDLRGASALRFFDIATRAGRERPRVRVAVLTQSGERIETDTVHLQPSRFWWTRFITSLAGMATGVFLLLRAPHWHLARRTLVVFWCFGVAAVVHELISGSATAAEAVVDGLATAAGSALLVANLQDFSPSAPPVPWWQRALPAGAAALPLGTYLVFHHLPRATGPGDLLIFGSIAFVIAACLFALTRAYLGSSALDRRQLRWIVLGFYVGLVGVGVASVASLPGVFPRLWGLGIGYGDDVSRVLRSVFNLAVPASLIGAVIGSRWLDVDRLISATASWTLLGLLALGGALALVPWLARVSAPALDVSPAVVQWLATLGLLLGAVVAYRALWPRLDQQLFSARHRRMEGLERLVDELGGHTNPDELWKLVSERLDALLEPESLTVYVRDDASFVPRFVRGVTAAPSYDAGSVLAHALERRGRPLATDAGELEPFDRAALETLRVALVVPVRAREGVVAFACLGRKRSGDLYTAEERAHLAALAARCGDLLRAEAAEASPTPAQIFRREGDVWTLASDAREVRLRDMRGLHYLAMLLREPGREFAALDMVRVTNGLPPRRERDTSLGAKIDSRAAAEYRARVAALDAELAEAERHADLGRIERASLEREALVAELDSLARSRGAPPGSDVERARVAVTKAIKFALDRIAEVHPELGAHLAATIRRGYACAYLPDPRVPASWEI